jgi:hypothetical protein
MTWKFSSDCRRPILVSSKQFIPYPMLRNDGELCLCMVMPKVSLRGVAEMLFYTALFIASLIIVLVVLWFYRIVATLAQKISNSRITTLHLHQNKYARNVKTASQARHRKARSTSMKTARPHVVKPDTTVPWGWPGSDGEVQQHANKYSATTTNRATLNSYIASNNLKDEIVGDWNPNFGIPIRSERSGLTGHAYKPSERAISKFAINLKES